MAVSNYKKGDKLEQEVAEYLACTGFWVYRTPSGLKGQPFDLIAIRNDKAFLIECKYCSKDVFTTSRIEENQKNTARVWAKAGNDCNNLLVAIKYDDSPVYLFPFDIILKVKRISKPLKGLTLEEWIKKV